MVCEIGLFIETMDKTFVHHIKSKKKKGGEELEIIFFESIQQYDILKIFIWHFELEIMSFESIKQFDESIKQYDILKIFIRHFEDFYLTFWRFLFVESHFLWESWCQFSSLWYVQLYANINSFILQTVIQMPHIVSRVMQRSTFKHQKPWITFMHALIKNKHLDEV